MSKNQSGRKILRRIVISIVVCLVVIGVTTYLVVWIQNTEPTAEKSGATRKSAALVDTIVVEYGTYRPEIQVLGTVEPAKEITLSPQVSGQVLELSPEFMPGGIVNEGDLLLRIDPADFENTVNMRRSELHQTDAELQLELGQQNVAEQEFELLGQTINNSNRALILREPQIASARATIEAAKAAVANAELDLGRTAIRAPFNAQILSRNVNVGSQVAVGEELAQLTGIEEYWVVATVSMRELQWIRFATRKNVGSPVRLRKPGVWGTGVEREGRVERLIGNLDDGTRLARLIITVEDPLGRNSDVPPLLIGMIVEANISGRELADVVRVNQDYVRKGDTVWVLKDGKLDIRDINIVHGDKKYAYINQGIESGDRIVATNLATVARGIPLQDNGDGSEEGAKE